MQCILSLSVIITASLAALCHADGRLEICRKMDFNPSHCIATDCDQKPCYDMDNLIKKCIVLLLLCVYADMYIFLLLYNIFLFI